MSARGSDSSDHDIPVHFLGVTDAAPNSIRDKFAAVAPSPVNEGVLMIGEGAVVFSVIIPKLGRYVPFIEFVKNTSLRVAFQEQGRLLVIQRDGRAWLFFNEPGFAPNVVSRISAALRATQ